MVTIRTFVSGLLLLQILPAAQGVVHVVDASGAGAYLFPQPAALAAADGDVILLRPGDYTQNLGGGAVTLDRDLSLTLVADGPGVRMGAVRIEGLTRGHQVVLRGMEIAPAFGGSVVGLDVVESTGKVLVEDCTVIGGAGFSFSGGEDGHPALHADGGASVFLADCVLLGGAGSPPSLAFTLVTGDGAPALEAVGGRLFVSGCSLTGGDGGDDGQQNLFGGNGGPAARADGAVLLIAGSTLLGGDGGDGAQPVTPSSYNAGNAVELVGAPSVLHLVEASLQPGTPGTDGIGSTGAEGVELVSSGSQVVAVPGPARRLSVEGPVREGQPIAVAYQGVAGDAFIAFVSLQAGDLFLPRFCAILALTPGAAFRWVSGSVVDPGGALTLPAQLPPLPAGVEGRTILVQAVALGQGLHLTDESTLVQLDASL